MGFVLGVVGGAGEALGQAYVEPGPAYAPRAYDEVGPERLSLIYSPEVELSNSTLGQALDRATHGGGVHNLGIEFSSPSGWVARYHVQLDYSYGYGYSGVRLEPLGFGWALPLVRAPGFRLELEPLISVADGMLLFTNSGDDGSNVTFLLGSGVEVQLNLAVGAFYTFASPLGIEVRWLEATTGPAGQLTTGADPYFRFRLGVGVQY